MEMTPRINVDIWLIHGRGIHVEYWWIDDVDIWLIHRRGIHVEYWWIHAVTKYPPNIHVDSTTYAHWESSSESLL